MSFKQPLAVRSYMLISEEVTISSNTSIAGTLTANELVIGNIKITYNAEKDSLDFTKVS